MVYPPLHRGRINLDISLLKLCGASQKTLLTTRQRNTDDIILPTWPKSLAEIVTVFVRGRRGPQEQSCFDGSNNCQRASFVSRPDVSAICKACGQTHSNDLTCSPKSKDVHTHNSPDHSGRRIEPQQEMNTLAENRDREAKSWQSRIEMGVAEKDDALCERRTRLWNEHVFLAQTSELPTSNMHNLSRCIQPILFQWSCH